METQDDIMETQDDIMETQDDTNDLGNDGNRFCKGNMPSPLVWHIRFHESGNNSSIARKYFTTPGKISDIKSGSNQKYIIEDMQWSKEDIEKAINTIKANFVRGQDLRGDMSDEEWANFVNANKRKIATTTMDDAEYSLTVLENIMEMPVSEGAKSLEEARAEYLAQNPRAAKTNGDDDAEVKAKPKKRGKKSKPEVMEDDITEEDIYSAEDLLS